MNLFKRSQPQPSEQKPYAGKPAESVYETLRTIVLVLITALLIRSFIAQPFVVEGKSMEPTLHNAEYLIVDKIEYRLHAPQRGDVIVFKAPEAPDQNYIKRIIGLPGETVTIKDNRVYVNGTQVEEQYIADSMPATASDDGTAPAFFLEQKLSSSEYFVMGDNRDHSSDSRRWGPLPKQNILGKAQVILFPFTQLSWISLPNYSSLARPAQS